MPSPAEVSVLVRRFRGVNVAVDPIFLDDRDLQAAENWVPFDLTGLLTKRRGTGSVPLTHADPLTRIDAILRTYNLANPPDTLMFVAGNVPSAGVDRLYVHVNDTTAATTITGGAALTVNQRYGMVVLGNRLYVGNGVDRLKVISLSAPTVATDLSELALMTPTGQAAVPVGATATAAELDAGTYSYTWAVYDHTNKKYLSRDIPRTVLVPSGNSLHFTLPTTNPGATNAYHLFVAPRNLPLEFATDQFPNGLSPGAPAPSDATIGLTVDLNVVRTGGNVVPVAQAIVRTGRFLVAHRGRLWIAGDTARQSDLYSTGPIVPGLEQAIFDQGDFFPALAVLSIAKNDGDIITGLGVAALTTTQQSPSAPLAVFKNRSTWLVSGNLEDGSLDLVQLSGRIGCIAHGTIVNTPVGLIFCGKESVYLLPPALQEPLDIGWPIAPVIKRISNGSAPFCFAIMHNGFYKLFLMEMGTVATQQWWLDLHRGVVDDPPSWWGPHIGEATPTDPIVGYTAATTGLREASEVDKGWAASGTSIWPQDAVTSYTDLTLNPVISRLKTRAVDGGRPFARKTFTGMRIIARAQAGGSINPAILYDDGMASTPQGFSVGTSVPVLWTMTWDVTWGTSLFAESDTRLTGDLDRQPHLTAEVSLVHASAARVDLRDFELRYLPVERPVA